MKSNFLETKKAVDDITTAIDGQIKSAKQLDSIIVSLNGNYSKLPSEYLRNQKQIADTNIKIAKSEQEVQKVIIATERAKQASLNTTIKETREKERQIKLLEKEQAKLQASQSLYNKVQTKLNTLSAEYKDLAIKKELTNKLTDDEAKRYTFLQGKIQQYDKTLKAVDATMGKYQRNVGNYASGFNPLSNSINQLTREMPAFANSVQTGFMALSNNIPIFFDAIQQTNAELKTMRANGEQVPSLLSRLTSSFLTWGTALSIGVTLLTVFGDEIVDSIFSTKKKAQADEEAKKAVEAKNEAERKYLETIRNSAGEEIARSQILFENAKNVNLSMRERLKAISDLRERYPEYLKNLSNQQILAGDTADAENRLNDALVKRGVAIGLQSKLTEEYNKLAEVLIKVNDVQNNKSKLEKEDLDTAKRLGISVKQLAKDRDVVARLNLAQYEKERIVIQQNIDNILDLFNKYSPYLDSVRQGTETIKSNTKAKEENAKIFTEQWFEQQIKVLEEQRSKVADTTLEYASFTNQINVLKMLLEQLQGKELPEITLKKEQLEALEKGIETMTKFEEVTPEITEAEKALKSLFKTIANDSLNSYGMGSLIPMFDGTFNKMWETANTFNEKFAVGMKYIGDVAKETFSFINQQQQAQFEAQFARLEQERDVALMFAGESASAREEIERQYEERRRAIQRRQAESQKKMAIFNTIINTAQGVVSALAMTPPNVPLSIAIGVIGAVQTAMIASQQIPQFYKGTDNAPEGWAYTQEKGREIITDKHGKIKSMGSDKGAELTYLNKGDKVFTASQTEQIMFNDNLNSILTSNGISAPIVNNTVVNVDTKGIIKAIENKDTLELNFDANGFSKYKQKQGQRVKIVNNRLRINSYDI